MTGPEHYAEAERLLSEQVFFTRTGSRVERTFEETVAAAQVHTPPSRLPPRPECTTPASCHKEWHLAAA